MLVKKSLFRGCDVTYVRIPEGYKVDLLARDATGEPN